MNQLKSLAYNLFYNFKPIKVFSAVITEDDINILPQFSRNEAVVVSRADKGRGVVIVDRSDYIKSLTTLLSDTTKFKEITRPIHKFVQSSEDEIKNFLRKLENLKLFDEFL